MLTIDNLRHDLNIVMKTGETKVLEVLRLIIGECELREKSDPIKVIRKLIQANDDCLKYRTDPRLEDQNRILRTYLPLELNLEQLETAFLSFGTSELDLIRGASNEGAAIGIAVRFTKSNKLAVANNTIIEYVKRVREINE